MSFNLQDNEKIVWHAEQKGEFYSIWPIIDDGNPNTNDELTDRTFQYRQSIGIRKPSLRTNRFDITRPNKESINCWLKAHGFNFTFDDIVLGNI